MKFSRNLLSRFIDISQISDEQLAKTLNDIGLEVENITKIGIPKNVVLGKVIRKIKHPDADKLSVCDVDIGNEILQIVCGAKNVSKDQYVPVALVGANLGNLKIKKSTLRGIESNGMICSSTELGLPKIEDGIFVLDSSIGELVLGRELCEYEIFNDTLFEVGVTPNRGDCFSLLGIAKDLAVAFNLKLKIFKEKERNNDVTPGIGRILNVSFDNNLQSSLYYKVVKFEKLEILVTLKFALALCDKLQKDSLRNIVEFATYMTGVLINAYKFDSYNSNFLDNNAKIHLHIKKDQKGIESVYCENNKLSDIGIYVDNKYNANENSALVVFEAIFIPAKYVSEIIFNNQIQVTDEISYYSKRGSSPLLEDGIAFLCYLISGMSKSTIYSSSQDIIQNYPLKRIDFNFDDINDIIGNVIKSEEITDILKKMDFKINPTSDDSFIAVNPPLYRQDINTIQDVAEEILRIKSIDSVTSIPQKFTQYQSIDINYYMYRFNRSIAQKAIANKFFECVHYVFYKKDILESYGYETLLENLDLSNPITNELNTLRSSLIPAMLDSIARNKNYGYDSIRLFEIGSIYTKNRVESKSLAFVASGNKTSPKYPNPKGESWDFYSFASSISNVIGRFNLESTSANIIYHTNICANIMLNGQNIGLIGKINPYISNKLEISEETFVCEISFDKLFSNHKMPQFREFSKYQASQRDITILLDSKISFGAIKEAILAKVQSGELPHIREITPLDSYKDKSLWDKYSLSFRITLQSMSGTLSEEELKIDNLLNLLSTEFGAELR
ncbi:phenylalanine--tRNA ligase subunit beta [Helicobacter sp. 16-1353]|uniref:phenylalanine--tRNA ligase subunit beta n=1 Tax=Helicobacter sp. 16-1353 TaxID=2004996 RepID=UPI000DCC770A|nr:phenylalanine--tRNA ligase subunit beta [Helicobacter sp. 16-1353]RAX51797.1 phenylalanine--tRNA ligase subunit beta [Helicobacter sp. 16-1353]